MSLFKIIGATLVVIGFTYLLNHYIEASEEIFLKKERVVEQNETLYNVISSLMIVIGLIMYL